ncbi:MAG: hypothetical protein HRK26_04310 [Rickettsiaceae bacterium H1]|nr:hypothetical protein [Rickettsiaceae bacterium H1]
MSIRKIIFSALCLLILIIATVGFFYQDNIKIYDAYVNKYILNTFQKVFPDFNLKISNIVVNSDNSDYKISLFGILVKDKDGLLIGKIPKIDATVHVKYFFSGFTLKHLDVTNPKVILPASEGFDLDKIKKVLSYVGKYVDKGKLSNLLINNLHLDEIYFGSISRYNSNVVNISIKKGRDSYVQLEVRLASYTTISSQFSNIDLSYTNLIPQSYQIIISGNSIFTFNKKGEVSSGSVKINDILGKVYGDKRVEYITSGTATAKIKKNILSIMDLDFFTKEKKISLSGRYSLNNRSMDIIAQTDSVEIGELLDFWPQGIGQEGEKWFRSHVAQGNFLNPKLRIKGGVENVMNIDLAADFANGKLLIEELFSPVTDLSGYFSILDDQLNVVVKTGKLGDINLSNGVITKQDIGSSSVPLIINGKSKSRLKVLYSFLNDGELKKKISEIDANADAQFSFAINDSVERKIEVAISNVHSDSFLKVFNIQDGNFDLNIENDRWDLFGNGIANSRSFTLNANNDSEVIKAKLQGEFCVSDLLKMVGFDVKSVSGDVNVNIDSSYIDDYHYINCDIDISDSLIDIGSIGWRSEIGEYGSLIFNVVLKDGDSFSIPNLDLNSDKVKITARANVEKAIITDLKLSELTVGDNHIMLSYKEINGTKHIVIKGDKLALDQLSDGNFDIDENLYVVADLGEIILNNNISVFDFHSKINPKYKDSYITGRFNDDKAFIIENNENGFLARSNDAGLLLSALGITEDVNQGILILHSPPDSIRGNLILKDFFLVKAPILTQILSLASLQGIVNTLNNDGIYFNQLQAPFTFQNNIANFDESWLEGMSLGISFEGPIDIKNRKVDLSGYVVPIYFINKLIWKTPVIGRLLTGGKGRGIISIDYRLQTQEDGENKISVNMISILTPKILQRVMEIFKYH